MKKIRFLSLSRQTKRLLRIALPLILLSSIALLLSYLEARQVDAVAAAFYYPPLLEYIVASLLLTVGGAFLIERSIKDIEKKDP